METVDDRSLAWKYQGNWRLEDDNSDLNNSTTWTKAAKNATADITFVGSMLCVRTERKRLKRNDKEEGMGSDVDLDTDFVRFAGKNFGSNFWMPI